MCNLVMSEAAQKRLRSPAGAQDIKLLVLFANTDDAATQVAATGALAMLSGDAVIAASMGAYGAVDAFVPLLAEQTTSREVRHRVNVCIQNMAAHCLDAASSVGLDGHPDGPDGEARGRAFISEYVVQLTVAM
jgi:hypothetical protein